MYTHWLYTGVIEMSNEDAADLGRIKYIFGTTQILDAYVLAHYLLDCAFQNACIDKIIRLHKDLQIYPGISQVNQIWDKIPEDCGMRRLMVSFFVKSTGRSAVASLAGKMPADFMIRMMEDLIDLRDQVEGWSYPAWNWRCEYHSHDDRTPKTEACGKTQDWP